MGVTFIHTADWQLGKPFAFIRDDAKRHLVQHERVNAIGRIADAASAAGADFVLVAGDLFDSPSATRATVSAACSAIGAMRVPVLAIPGNHDHGGPGSIWEQEFFRREHATLAPNLHVMLRPEPVVLDRAVIFPAPLLNRHQAEDPVAWIREAASDPALPGDRPFIVLAHGSVQEFGSAADQDADGEGTRSANRIDLERLPGERIDYVALGDWHGTRQVTDRAWYSGTPEADRFPKGSGYDPGNVLRVTVDRGRKPEVERLPTGRLSWRGLSFHFTADSDPQLLDAQVTDLTQGRPGGHLLQLTLDGSLGIEAAGRLDAILESWESRLLHLRIDGRCAVSPTEAEVAALTERVDDPLISFVARQLVDMIQKNPDEAEVARLALRELHSALR